MGVTTTSTNGLIWALVINNRKTPKKKDMWYVSQWKDSYRISTSPNNKLACQWPLEPTFMESTSDNLKFHNDMFQKTTHLPPFGGLQG